MKFMNSAHDCISVCNSLLRGELSAVETYADTHAAEDLRRIWDEHQKSVDRLTGNVREMGGEPDKGSGGRDGYQNARLDEHVISCCKEMIGEELLPG